MLDWFDLQKLEFYHYIAFGGGAVLLLALLLYALPGARTKLRVPAIVTAAICGLVLGVAVGVLGLARYGYALERPVAEQGEEADGGEAGPPGRPPAVRIGGGGRPEAPGGGGRRRPGGGGGNRGPSAKVRLALLVAKLDLLTDEKTLVEVNDAQRKEILAQLKDLAAAEELKDDEAQKRLDALHKTLEGEKSAFSNVGYNWEAGQGRGPRRGGQQGPPPANPFKEGTASKHLQALQERLGKEGQK